MANKQGGKKKRPPHSQQPRKSSPAVGAGQGLLSTVSAADLAASNLLLQHGIAAQERGDIAAAIRHFQESLARNPRNPWTLYSLGTLEVSRDPQAAFTWYDRAVRAAPQVAKLWYARAKALVRLLRREEANADFDRALALDPQYFEALNDSAALLLELHRPKDALGRFARILAMREDPVALSNVAVIHSESINDDDLVKAVQYLERLVAIDPDYRNAIGRMAYQRLHICDWRDYGPLTRRVREAVLAGKPACSPFPIMVMSGEAREHQMCARTYADFLFPPTPAPIWRGERYQHDRIRIAYVSPDFGNHPVGQLMAGVVERHDRSRFEVIAISMFDNDKSERRARLVKAFDQFHNVQKLEMRDIAMKMRELEVDIAVDLAGYTRGTGSPALAHRPAPVQVNFLGYPGTIGVRFLDYLIADRHVIPPEHRQFYDEEVVYLPDAYLPTDGSLVVADRTPTRAECGLPEEGFVFCSFSHDHKIAPPVFDVWMRLLHQVPGSVLWLMTRLETCVTHLRREAQERGIDPDRLIFATRVPALEDHLARYRQAGIFLDTSPYNAHTTTADALYVGVPVLTVMGNAFPSRVAASLLHAIGLPQAVTYSLEEYEALALQLARDPVLLAQWKATLEANRRTHPLFDTTRYCRNLEALFEDLHDRRRAQPVSAASEEHLLLQQSVTLRDTGRIEEARALIAQCLQRNSGSPLALYAMATLLLQYGNQDAALEFLTQAVARSKPPYAPLWFAHGFALAQRGRKEEALQSYEQVLALEPRNTSALKNSCILLRDLGRTAEAQERYRIWAALEEVRQGRG
ncbi:tetratricopeptide repeat protein [Candidatus Symbiobacter mobilis]|uniref:protein O-GlcNAc transferase n=1 Tax=Candidatus Symbiobacter mobilis CR TaxID=946483 RepID=U5NDU7_9BURK|nr:tetratricopeptide repeat protein [Candidatus Symbiobacter mobilis]AGX88378.1 O-linked N-acetylglucosamine transferase-like protein [Candidatus Symbiobacter mobilis CR]